MNIAQLIDIRQTAQYATFIQSLGWKIVTYKSTQIFIKKLPLFPLYVGKLLRTHNTLKPNEIRNIIKRYRLISFSFEPNTIEKNDKGLIYYQTNRHSMRLTPTKTLWINLTHPEQILLSELKTKTRYNLKKAQTQINYEIIDCNNFHKVKITEILSVWSANKPYSWLFPAPKNEFMQLLTSFGDKSFIVRCFEKHTPTTTLAFCLVLYSSNMAFYWHNGSSTLGRHLFAPTLCVWQAMMESKKRGLRIFDFEGLYDERFPKNNTSWKGFTKFKQGFSYPNQSKFDLQE